MVPDGFLMVPDIFLMVPDGFLMVPDGFLMVPDLFMGFRSKFKPNAKKLMLTLPKTAENMGLHQFFHVGFQF